MCIRRETYRYTAYIVVLHSLPFIHTSTITQAKNTTPLRIYSYCPKLEPSYPKAQSNEYTNKIRNLRARCYEPMNGATFQKACMRKYDCTLQQYTTISFPPVLPRAHDQWSNNFGMQIMIMPPIPTSPISDAKR